jgi:hypothetical protein
MVLVPHSDLIVHSDRFFVAPVEDNTINIAFIGRFTPINGAGLFCGLSSSAALLERHGPLTFRFHQFGGSDSPHPSSILTANCTSAVTFHAERADRQLEALLQEKKIHIVTFLSLSPETHSYALTRVLRAGIPLVYLNRGAALTERLAGVEHAFSVEEDVTLAGLEAGVSRAVEFVMRHHQGIDTILREQSANVSAQLYPSDLNLRAKKKKGPPSPFLACQSLYEGERDYPLEGRMLKLLAKKFPGSQSALSSLSLGKFSP